MSEAEWQIERELNSYHSTPKNNQVDCRAILHMFSDDEVKRVAKELYESGYKGNPKYEKMNLDIMNNSFSLSDKQKNALITFIMYAK